MEKKECWGSHRNSKECRICEFKESCAYGKADNEKTNRNALKWKNGAVEFDEEIANIENAFPIDIETEGKMYSRSEMITAIAFVLRLKSDDKITEFLSKRICEDKSFSDIARDDGVSRQAVHKRIGHAIEKLFGYKKNRITDARLMQLTTREFEVYGLRADGLSYMEIAKKLGISKMHTIRTYRLAGTKLGIKCTDCKGAIKKIAK